MKKVLSLLILAVLAVGKLSAQTTPRRQQNLPPPVPFREVSGIVKDSTGQTLPGSIIKLVSKTDTAGTSANADGIFIFKNIKSATFTITISSIGYRTIVKKMLNNDAVTHLVLDPFILKTETNVLKTVTIDGTPSIVYKVDTVEYKASDYKVRPNATVDEMLKKAEGFEIGSDGSATYQGVAISSVNLNGKAYAGGGVAQAIQNLPADIVDKFQVVDFYGEDAARTGIKDGDPQKVLNLTTRADKSVGLTGRLTGQGGNNDRYRANLFLQRINANQQLGVIGSLENSINGVASTASSGGAGGRTSSPGTTFKGGPTFSYRDQWSKNVQVNSSYGYTFSNNDATNHTYGDRISQKDSTIFDTRGKSQSNSKNHQLRFEIEYNIDSADFLRISPSYSYTNSTNNGNSFTDDQTYTFHSHKEPDKAHPGDSIIVQDPTTHVHSTINTANFSSNTNESYGANLFYQHIFKKPRRNFSISASINKSNSTSVNNRNSLYQYYNDSTGKIDPTLDSLSHLIITRTTDNTTSQFGFNYVEPVGLHAQFEFTSQITHSSTDNVALSDQISIDTAGKLDTTRADGLSNIFNYSTTETRIGLRYSYNNTKLRLTLGAEAVPYVLDGTKVDNSGTGENVSTSTADFRIIPVANFSYNFSKTERLNFGYSGRNTEPSFDRIQPFTDRTNPDNIIIGNPNLKAQFTHSLRLGYNNYFSNSKFTMNLNLSGSTVQNQTTTNVINLQQLRIVKDSKGKLDSVYKNVRETHYVNVSGSHSFAGGYGFDKQLDDRRYRLSFNGNISYSYNNYVANNQPYHNTLWRFDEKFEPQMNPTENIQFDPYIGYTVQKSFSKIPPILPGGRPTINNTNITNTAIGTTGYFYFLKTFQVHYDASKNLQSGIPGQTNPLIINAGFQKEFGAKRSIKLTFDIIDLLHQNNYLQPSINSDGTTYTESNTNSRFFLIGFVYNFQKWSGTPQRNGRNMNRRGDGSFIYQ